ncbi:hypothetical protein CR156_17260 [Stenotrophomonas lactitubi]|uniref:hypothetical protein n=1 Tax=Stenotrophomonas lactitubi TaxID=2045214 RepID=UPI000C27421A|nr:hypothetical protein [Stenotrophomonas lactitubi]PJO53792.1 hypothetical protein CR156_17260 [Stenotrophomonas lactitubi]
MSASANVTDAMVHAFEDAYCKNWEAQRCAPEGTQELGTFFATRAGLSAALSAQPSPGGQDALLASLVARWRKDADEVGASDNTMCQKIANCTMRHAAELQAVIAARQPVGAPVCSGGFLISNGSGEKYMAWGQVGPEWTADKSAALWLVRRADAEALAAENEDAWSILPVERCALPPNGWACTLADGHEGPCPTIAAPPAQAADSQPVGAAVKDSLTVGGGLPVAEIFAAFRPDGSIAGTAFSAEEAGYWQGCKVVRYTTPSAQAVDLPYSLDADPAGIRARVADVITGTLMVGAQGHTPPPAGHWAEPFWQAARADAKAQAVDLDPINVFVQDYELGRGRIVVTCYGQAWCGFWGAMGERTVMQFVAACDADYVAGNMLSGRHEHVKKHERVYVERIAAEVIAEFRALIDNQAVGNG